MEQIETGIAGAILAGAESVREAEQAAALIKIKDAPAGEEPDTEVLDIPSSDVQNLTEKQSDTNCTGETEQCELAVSDMEHVVNGLNVIFEVVQLMLENQRQLRKQNQDTDSITLPFTLLNFQIEDLEGICEVASEILRILQAITPKSQIEQESEPEPEPVSLKACLAGREQVNSENYLTAMAIDGIPGDIITSARFYHRPDEDALVLLDPVGKPFAACLLNDENFLKLYFQPEGWKFSLPNLSNQVATVSQERVQALLSLWLQFRGIAVVLDQEKQCLVSVDLQGADYAGAQINLI